MRSGRMSTAGSCANTECTRMPMHDISHKELIDHLTESYTRQLELYRRLTTLGQRILGQLSVSRGDLNKVMPLFEEKQLLLDQISTVREQSTTESRIWQEKKDQMRHDLKAQTLDSIFENTRKSIQRFLSTEDQVRRYLEHLMSSGEEKSNERA